MYNAGDYVLNFKKVLKFYYFISQFIILLIWNQKLDHCFREQGVVIMTVFDLVLSTVERNTEFNPESLNREFTTVYLMPVNSCW